MSERPSFTWPEEAATEISRLKTNLEHWRHEVGKKASQIERLRAELAAEKERAWTVDAELLSLRKEVAAETRRAEVFLEEKLWNIATEKERCAKIADVIAEEGKLTTCYWRLRKVAAAIRASNAKGEDVQTMPQTSDGNERWVEVTCVDCWKVFDARVPPSATEARMLELARAMTSGNGSYEEWGHAADALAALVIETFGEKK